MVAGRRRGAESFDPGAQLMSLLKPVAATMALVVYLVGALGRDMEVRSRLDAPGPALPAPTCRPCRRRRSRAVSRS